VSAQVYGEPAPPPAPTAQACSAAGNSPCTQSCADGTYDLSGFQAQVPDTGFFDVQDADQHHYYFDACGAVDPTQLTCVNDPTADPVAIQTYSTPAPKPPRFPSDGCASLGAEGTRVCTSSEAGLNCTYTGGKPGTSGGPGRSVTFLYTCAHDYTPPTATQPNPVGQPLYYLLTFTGPGGCPGAALAGGGGMSWGTLFLILFPIAIGLYVGGGYYYNYKYKEMRGVDAVPQLEYWKQVPGLVKDGCAFSYEQTSHFIAYVRERQRGGPPADATLKTSLADNEGGEPSTAYEEAGPSQ